MFQSCHLERQIAVIKAYISEFCWVKTKCLILTIIMMYGIVSFFSGTIYTQDSFLKLSKTLCDNVTPVCMPTYFRKTFRFVWANNIYPINMTQTLNKIHTKKCYNSYSFQIIKINIQLQHSSNTKKIL